MFDTNCGIQMSHASVINYFDSLVNKLFKILPMREESESSLSEYIVSLQREMLGFGNMIPTVGDDKIYVSILSVLQFFIDNIDNENCKLSDIRSEVFHIISLCNKLKDKYRDSEVHDGRMG